ncbi:MAG: dTDP-4-dehydrorhamnose reductase [Magnetococcales bacterium]|nr:dTDP-4-dehydrorhamnose reductase [Magnetococcales bacterium]
MRLLLTGANGQVGREITLAATDYGFTLLPMSRLDLDIGSRESVLSCISRLEPQVVINAAAFTDVDGAESEPELALASNQKGPENLALACSKHSIPLLHISTDFVFDGEQQHPYKESDRVNPLSHYGQSKWLGEQSVRAGIKEHIILRVSWVFGRFGRNFFSAVPKWVREKMEMQVVADQVGGPTPAQDIAQALLVIASRAVKDKNSFPWGTYHFAGQPAVSRFEYTQFIVERLKEQGVKTVETLKPVPASVYPMPAMRPAYSALDSTLLEKTFGIKAPTWQKAAIELLAVE